MPNKTITGKLSNVLNLLFLDDLVSKVQKYFTKRIWKASFQSSLLVLAGNQNLVQLHK